MLLIIMAMALGFTVAGFLTALHRTVFPAVDNVGEGALLLQFDTVGHSVWSSVICTLAGPYILFVNAIRFWLRQVLSFAGLTICASVSLLWSFCSGVLIVETLIAAGIIQI
jgi:hypothetical protein